MSGDPRPSVALVRADGLAPDLPYAAAAVAPSGSRLVLLAGACPLDVEGRTVAHGDVRGQTEVCLENARIALAAAGGVLTDVVFIRVIVATTDRRDLAAAWQVVREAFGPHDAPGTLQGATVLGWPDQLVEVELVAAVRDS